MIVALALANGFRDEMRDKILRGTAHITIMRADGQPMADYRQTIERVTRIPGVIGAAPTTYDGAVVTGANSSTYAVIRGIDSESAPARLELARTLVAGSFEPLFEPAVGANNEPRLPNVVIGAELAKQTGLQVGDIAEIIPASASLARRAPIRRNVQVVGIFRSGLFEYDTTWIYISFDRAAIFAGSERAASLISVAVQDVNNVKPIAAQLRATLGDNYWFVDWEQANVQLFSALELERRAGLFVIALIILIAALNITTTLVLVVVERRSDIAILRTMGATAKSVMFIFLLEGAIVGTVGALMGVVLGWAGCFLGNYYKIIRLPPGVYSIGNVPFNSHLSDVALAALVAFVLTVLATIYPAQAAARMRPVETLRERN